MPRADVDTRAEIRAAAVDLFARRGYDATSLREIAERIGVTKAALYYHYPSKDALLADLVDPMLDGLRELAADLAEHPARVRDLLERYWDFCLQHRYVLRVLVHNASVVGHTGIAGRMIHWREGIDAALAGGDAPGDRVRAVVALGGLQDAVVLFGDDELPGLREAAVDAAERALGPR
ncbi:TetR/AcrR family transcriptional regulator [Pseudonocardia phyllosphaerae]|uniref:TetR/AcrR family transcriptional regulator n=1 Tax=Pseudonocardia phyllosphaerae TaxID=3390502 RepID=UPI0039794CE1